MMCAADLSPADIHIIARRNLVNAFIINILITYAGAWGDEPG